METDLLTLNLRKPAPFNKELVLNLNDYLSERGITLSSQTRQTVEDVSLDKIVGLDQGYETMNWAQLLHGHYLKRLNRNLIALAENPGYYLNGERMEGLSFIKVEEDYFIDTGKHRVTLARYFAHFNSEYFPNGPVLKNVVVEERVPDYSFMRWNESLRQLKSRYPALQYQLTYAEDESAHCLSLYGVRDKMESYCRADVPEALDQLSRPSVLKKLQGERTHQFVSLKDCHWF